MVLNTKQLNFVMDKLGFTGGRRKSCKAIIINGATAYSTELLFNLSKNTANRDAIKCAVKWGELLDNAESVNDLLQKGACVVQDN